MPSRLTRRFAAEGGHPGHRMTGTGTSLIHHKAPPGGLPPWREASRGLRCMAMAEIVLRVRLIGGEHLDVPYKDAGAAQDEMVEEVISILAADDGVLRCRHGDRLMVLYGRGIATL